jgi:predicted RNA-binding Zn ribbon-like protein
VEVTRPAETQTTFPFHHGRLALSFAGTVGDRGSARTERLPTSVQLGVWLRQAALTTKRLEPSAASYRRALRLREAIARVAAATTTGKRAAGSDIAVINDVARRWAPRPYLDPKTLSLTSGDRDPVDAAIGRIALDAIALFSDPEERARLRTCGLDSCGAIFLTPAGHRERRWCSMARCGNRAKVTAFRKRAHSAGSAS